MSNVTVIDTKRGLRPQGDDAALAAQVKAFREKARDRDAHGFLGLALTGELAG